MKRIYLFFTLLLVVTLTSNAHEFWLQPTIYFALPNQVVSLNVLVGEHFQGERSEAKKNRIVQYAHYSKSTKEDLTPQFTGGHYGSTPVKLAVPGTHLIAFTNTNKYIEMRADSFLLYLQEDGLDPVIQYRQAHKQTQKRSREFYRRCVKSLLQVGPFNLQDKTYSLNSGMPLEIIPTQNPYSLKPGKTIRFTVLFENKPLPNALVRYWNRATIKDSAPADFTEQQQRTNANGQVSFQLQAGNNMVSLVQMVPYADTKQADWQSYWASLTFGCR